MNDPTKCQGCGGVPEAGYTFPLCASCRTALANRPFPRSIFTTGAGVLIILVIALSQSPRTLLAGVAFERGQAHENAGAYTAAVSNYRRVTESFP